MLLRVVDGFPVTAPRTDRSGSPRITAALTPQTPDSTAHADTEGCRRDRDRGVMRVAIGHFQRVPLEPVRRKNVKTGENVLDLAKIRTY
jgi:hypothetical protein